MKNQDWSKLKRDQHPMPEFMRKAIADNDMMNAYLQRPPYQQNDYVWWITSPKREETKQKRLVMN